MITAQAATEVFHPHLGEYMKKALKKAWEAWKSFAHKLGDFQARLILTVLYFVIVGPFSLLVRFGGDPLTLKRGTARGWTARTETKGTALERATQQF
jgi:hypothetical protein